MQRVAKNPTELLDHANGAQAVTVAYEHGDRIQAVEQEMRIHSRLQRREPRRGELARDAHKLQLAIPILGEVPDCVLDAHDEEVDGNAKRERREDPARVEACDAPVE